MFGRTIKTLYFNSFRGIAVFLCIALVLGLYIPMPVQASGTGVDTWHLRDCPTSNQLKSVTFGNDIFVAVGASGTIIWSSDGTNWALSNSPTDRNLSNVAYGAGVFVAVGEGGTIVKSGDGKSWTMVLPSGDLNSYDSSLNLAEITYSSKFVAAGNWRYGGVFLESNDGLSWTSFEDSITWTSGQYHGTDASGLGLYGIAWGGNKYVGVGKSFDGYPLLIESTDGTGTDWVNNKVLSNSSTLYDVAYDGGTFYIVGNNGGIIKKSSGQSSWTAVDSGIGNDLIGVAAHDGTIVAVGSAGRVFASTDSGVTWSLKYSASGVYILNSVAYGKNTFAAVGSNSGILQSDTLPVIDKEKPTWPGSKAVMASGTTSTDTRLSWTGASDNIAVSGYRIFQDGSQIASVAANVTAYNVTGLAAGTSYTFKVEAGDASDNWTTDGPTVSVTTSTPVTGWYTRTSGTSMTLYSVAYTGNNFVAVGDRGVILTSSDGISWTSRNSGTTNLLRGVAYAGGTLVAVGDGTNAPGSILYSTDSGQTWSSPDSPPNCILRSITFGNGKFVAVGESGITFTSSNGINWDYDVSGNGNDQWGVAYGGGTFVGINYNSTVRTSINGMEWSDQTAAGCAVKFGIGYGGGVFVAVGPGGTLATSTDAKAWTLRNSNTVTTLRNVAYGNDIFVVPGYSDTILISTNTRDWIPTNTNNFNAEFYGAAYGGGKFVVVGAGGRIVQSNSTIPQSTYTLDVKINNGSVSRDPFKAAYDEGDKVTLTATPNSGYRFTGWSGDASGTEKTITVTMDGNKDITANTALILNSVINPAAGSFDKKAGSQSDVQVDVTANGNILNAIKNGNTLLVQGDAYSVAGTKYYFKKEYLASQPIGTTVLTFDFDAGIDPTLSIAIADTTVYNSTINPISANFDKKAGAQEDINVIVTYNGNTLNSITSGEADLILRGTDYIVSGNNVTILKEYLAKQPVGITTLNFDFSAGADKTLILNITDTTAPTQASIIYTISPSDTELIVGDTRQSVVTAVYSNRNTYNVTRFAAYSSSYPEVARVDNSGLITALNAGQTVISAVYGGQTAAVNINVNLPAPALTLLSYSINPDNADLNNGDTRQSVVTAVYSDGKQYDITQYAVFSSSQPNVASVTSQGLITAVSSGQTVVSAVYGGRTATKNITVNGPLTLTFSLSPNSAVAGDTISISAETSPNTSVAITVVKADGTVVYNADVSSDGSGNYKGSFIVPSDMSSGILYGTAKAGEFKVISNIVVRASNSNSSPTVVIAAPSVTVDNTNKRLEITNITIAIAEPINISIPLSVPDASINVTQMLNAPAAGTVTTNPLPALNIAATTSISNTPVQLAIPDGMTVSAPAAWDGTIHVPAVQENSTVTVTADAGKAAAVNTVIEVGFGDVPLTLSKAVRILIPGQAGKDAGYFRGSTFTKIAGTISADTQTAADAEISAGGDAAIDVGPDKVIWTKHFTKFVTYTQTAVGSGGNRSGGNRSGGNSNTSPGAGVTNTQPTAAIKDIAGHWAKGDIEKLVAAGAIKGYPDGNFKPDSHITRAEFVTILVMAFKLEVRPGKVFKDTEAHWAKEYIAAASAHGIAGGYDDTTFGPNDLITREQMAVMIVKASKLAETTGTISFTDKSNISAWAERAVVTAKEHGIIEGYPDGCFKPQGSATRAEAVTMIIKAIK